MYSLNQKKLLKLLAINCRYSNKDLAKSIGVSEDVIRYQIDRLTRREKLLAISTSFHFSNLGFYLHHYLIRFKNIEEQRIEKLIGIKEIFFLNKSTGKYDLQIIICHRTDEELLHAKEKIDQILKGNIDESVLVKFYRQYKWTNVMPTFDVSVKLPASRKNQVYSLNKEDWHTDRTTPLPVVKFNENEKNTVRELLKNSRESYSEIGKKTKQSYETVRQQVYKFIEKGYIGNFGMTPNPQKFGLFTSYFLLNIRDLNTPGITSYIQSKKNIFYTAELIGKYNLILYIAAQTPQELHREAFELRRFLKDQILDLEMLNFDETLKSVQFPEVLLDE
jgi:DNA-binding Lrp family transcriptional regulator